MTKSIKADKQKHVIALAARLIRVQGYENTTIRDIASAAGMLPGSLYYHFPSKADLLFEVHRRGMEELLAAAVAALVDVEGPWERLKVACRTHVQMILEGEEYIGVAVFSLPNTDQDLLNRLTAARDSYEDIYRQLVAELPLPGDINRKHFRLALLGALNHTEVWYEEGSLGAHEVGVEICDVFYQCVALHKHNTDVFPILAHAALIEQAMDLGCEQRPAGKENRKEKILAAAAHLFANRGYKSTSMRDIAEEAGLEAGSIYYHFKSKTELFIATINEAAERRSKAINLVSESVTDPWSRLEVSCAIHLEFLLAKNDFATVIRQPTCVDDASIWNRLLKIMEDVKTRFKDLIDEVDLPPSIDKKLFLYVLMGALTTVHVWYRPHRESPTQIAQHIVHMLHPG